MQPTLALLSGALLVSASLAQAAGPPGPDAWATDAQGWTILPDTSRQLYVSVGGSDLTGAGTLTAPFRTVVKALQGSPPAIPAMAPGDCLNIKCGDSFPESFTQCAGNWTLSGASLLAPTVVRTYIDGPNTGRPIFQCGNDNGLQVHAGVHDVRFVGLELKTSQPNPSASPFGISLLWHSVSGPSQRVLFEDFRVSGFSTGVRFQGDPAQHHQDIRLRRSVVIDSYATNSVDPPPHAQGLFADTVDGLLIEECLFDHNGWNPSVGAWATIFRHNVYIQDSVTNVTVRGNIVARAGAHGIMSRPGGSISYNLMLRNPVNAVIGGSTGTPPTGVATTVVGNVMVDSADIRLSQTSADARGHSMVFLNLAFGDVHHNICAWNHSGNAKLSYQFDTAASGTVGIHNTSFHDNRSYDWRGPILFRGNNCSGLSFQSNHIQEPWIPVRVISAFAPVPTSSQLSSGNNRVHTIPAHQEVVWVAEALAG